MEKLLVVGVDGSPSSYTALRWALESAGRTGARVRAIRCWTPVFRARGWEAAVTGSVPPAEQQAHARRELAQVMAAALLWIPESRQVAVEQKVVRGPAGPMLVAHADGADLLVVGHGPRVAELLHRSVSWYCVRNATCPVLVIPPAMATSRTLTPVTAAVPAPVRPVPSSR
jgi:nucleotide-binding universal stress UspA family protein